MYYKKNGLLLIFATVLSLLGIVSISRTYILIIVVTWVLYLIMSGLKISKVFLIIVCFGMLLVLSFIVMPSFMSWVFGFLNERGQDITDGGLNGRIELFNFYNHKIMDGVWSLLFGHSQNYLSITMAKEASHNAIQEVVVCWGVLGLFVSIYWIYNLYKGAISKVKGYKIKMIYFLPMIIFILFIQSIQLFTMNCYLIVLLVSIIPLSMKEEMLNG